jgi:hypothetical protein
MLAFFNFYATYNKLQLQVEKKKLAEEQAALEAAENEGMPSDEDEEEAEEGINLKKS